MAATDEPDVDVNFPGEEDYEHLIEDYSHLAPPSEGELLQGHVVKVHPNEVIVDFGYKLEGLVPIEQFRQPDGTVTVKAGDAIDVMVDRTASSRKATSCSPIRAPAACASGTRSNKPCAISCWSPGAFWSAPRAG